jgi:hypothetical protein
MKRSIGIFLLTCSVIISSACSTQVPPSGDSSSESQLEAQQKLDEKVALEHKPGACEAFSKTLGPLASENSSLSSLKKANSVLTAKLQDWSDAGGGSNQLNLTLKKYSAILERVKNLNQELNNGDLESFQKVEFSELISTCKIESYAYPSTLTYHAGCFTEAYAPTAFVELQEKSSGGDWITIDSDFAHLTSFCEDYVEGSSENDPEYGVDFQIDRGLKENKQGNFGTYRYKVTNEHGITQYTWEKLWIACPQKSTMPEDFLSPNGYCK